LENAIKHAIMDLTRLNELKKEADKSNRNLKAELKRLLGGKIGKVYTVFEYHSEDGLMRGFPLGEGIREIKKNGKIEEVDDPDF